MTTYNYSQLETLWLDAAKGTKYATKGWAELMAAIAMAESSGNSQAYNPSGATGLWQILGAVNPSDQSKLYNPTVNAHEALLKLESQGLGAWVTYTSGAYKQFLQSGVNPSSLPSSSSQNPTTAQDLSVWSDITGNLNKNFPFFGDIVEGFTGTASTIGDVAKSMGGMVTDFAAFLKLISWMFVPAHWLRIAAFFAGVLFLGGSLYMFKEAL
jgi:Lysozyme like domain